MISRRVAVIVGGPSAEHDVSLVSGRAIAAALVERGHAVEGWLIDLDGGWWQLPPAAMERSIPARDYDAPAGLGAEGPLPAGAALERLRAGAPAPVVFIALHGPFGEDGTLQALCESADLVYTGAGVAASALGMDKALFKRLAAARQMPVVPWQEVTAADWRSDGTGVGRRLVEFAGGGPADGGLVVKPARLGSSIGISIVHQPADRQALAGAVESALAFDDLLVVEAYLDHAREFEVSVLGNGPADLQVFGPGEVFPGHEFYDYVAKYSEGVSRTSDQPGVAPELRRQIHVLAAAAFGAIGAAGFARVDFLHAAGRLYLNEINTIPGFTPISLFPVLCRQGGYDFGALAERIVELALARAAARPRRTLTRADLP